MIHLIGLFLLFSGTIPSGFQVDDAELSAQVKEITRLEAHIKANPKDRHIDLRRAELADAKFKAARLLCRKKAESKDEGIQEFVENEADKYFKDAVKLYVQLANKFEEEAGKKAPRKGRKKSPHKKLRDSGCMLVKAGVCHYFWKDLFTKGGKVWFQKIEDADGYLARAMGTVPLDDCVNAWAWLYEYLISSRLEQENACRSLQYAVMNLGHTSADMKKTFSRKSETAWMILDPLEGIYLHAARRLNEQADHIELAARGQLVMDMYQAAGLDAGPLGVRMRLEYCKAVTQVEGRSEAGKILVEAAVENCGNPLGREILPLLRDWVDFCSKNFPKKYSLLPQAILALANEYRMEGEYGEALAYYNELLGPDGAERFLKKHGPEILKYKGLCCYHLSLWPDAARAFDGSLARVAEAGKPMDKAALAYWHAALVEQAKSSKDEGDLKKSKEAEKRLKAQGMDPKEPLPLVQAPAACREVSFPPVGIFDEPFLSSAPLIVLKPPPRSGRTTKEDKPLLKAIEEGLDWLVRHQHSEGYWDCDRFNTECRSKKDQCSGFGSSLNDVGVTGLALLALLDGGSHPGGGEHQQAICQGLQYLCDIQDPEDGCLTPKMGDHYMYNHGIACLALTEAIRRFPWPSFVISAERAIAFVHKSKNRERMGKAWRYNIGDTDPIEANDVSVTGWMMRCLVSAARGGLTMYEDDLRDGLAYIEEMTDSRTGRTGYKENGSYCAREANEEFTWPFEMVESMTAVAMVCRYQAGELMDELDSQVHALGAGAELLLDKPPEWNENKGTIDYYYWHCGCEAMALKGGEEFEQWKEAAVTAILQNQEKRGCAKGSWDPYKGPWGDGGGRVYSTALCTLSLESLLTRKK